MSRDPTPRAQHREAVAARLSAARPRPDLRTADLKRQINSFKQAQARDTMMRIQATPAEKGLSGRLLAAVCRGMCGMAYRSSDHDQAKLILDAKFDIGVYEAEKQKNALKGALFQHFHLSAYERIAKILQSWNIVTYVFCDFYRMQVNADDIPMLVNARDTVGCVNLSDVLAAFLSFDQQHGWPAGHFPADLANDFREAGLLEGDLGSFNWVPEMLPSFDFVVADPPWDADAFFVRICRWR